MGRPKTHYTAFHYGFRFTLPDNREAEFDEIVEKLIKVVYDKEPVQLELFERTIGVENGWETGKPHIHFHFKSFHTDSNFRKTIIKKFMKEINDSRECNNAVYSLKKLSSEDLEDYNRFYRYPLKECGLKYKHLCKFPENWNIEYMAQLANDEMKNKLRDIAKTDAIEAKKEAKKAEFEDYIIKLNEQKPFKDMTTLYVEVMKYYAEESGGINPNHSWSKTLYWAVKFNITTFEEIARIKMQKEGF